MYQNQLRFFEDLMLRNTEATQAEKNKKPHENFDVSLIEQEKSSVLQYLRELKFFFPKEKHLVRIVNIYFERVIDLINRTHKLVPSPSRTKKFLPYHSAMAALKEILFYLEEQYGRYMDLNTCLPIPHEIELKNILIANYIQFKETARICPHLLVVIETVYGDFVEATERGKTTYYRAFYLLALINRLEKLEHITDTAIQRMLITFNFNSPSFIEYQKLKLRENGEALAFSLKEINQINVLPGLALNPLLLSAKYQLCSWLKQEIGFQENVSAAPVKKIMTTLSVPQLGNILKLFSDIGTLAHPNKTEMLEIFAGLFRTDSVENISPGSLRNHFYNEDASVSRSVYDLLRTALNKSKENT